MGGAGSSPSQQGSGVPPTGPRSKAAAAARIHNSTAAVVAPTRWSFVRGNPPVELLDLPTTAPKRYHTRSTVAQVDPNAATNVYPCFRGGLLFRIEDKVDKSWWFYNDTSDMEMHVEYHFGPGSRVEATQHVDITGPSTLPGTEGWIMLVMTVFPGETLRFIGKSSLNGFRSLVRIAPLSDKVAQRQQERINAAVATLQDEMEIVAKLTAEMDAPTEEQVVERCARQRVPFVDLGFRPMAESLFGPAAGALGREHSLHQLSSHKQSGSKKKKRAAAGMNSLSASHATASSNHVITRHSTPGTDVASAGTPNSITAERQPQQQQQRQQSNPQSDDADAHPSAGARMGVGAAAIASAAADFGVNSDLVSSLNDAYDGDARDLHRRLPPVVWLRPTQYLSPSDARDVSCVGRAGVSMYDVELGFLGDTWLLSTIAIVAQSFEIIEFIFRDSVLRPARPEQSVGAYRVSLNIDGWWTTLVLDDYVPCIGNRPAFASNRVDARDLWPQMLQKAFAKAYGSYAALSSGDPLLAMRTLTGCPTWRFNERWHQGIQSGGEIDEPFFELLLRFSETEQYLICLNSRGVDQTFSHDLSDTHQQQCQELIGMYESIGLAMGMAYSVLQCKYIRQFKLFLFKIRNPWTTSSSANNSGSNNNNNNMNTNGTADSSTNGAAGATIPTSGGGGGGKWNGNWSTDSDMWVRFPEVALECGRAKQNKLTGEVQMLSLDPEEELGNVFWMSWEDCLRYFHGGGVCFWRSPLSRIIDQRVMGHFVDSLSSVCVELHVTRKTRLTVVLSQNDSTGRDSRGATAAMMLSVAAPMMTMPQEDDDVNKDKENNKNGAPLYLVKWNSTTDPMAPSDAFTFTFARDLGIVLELEPCTKPYLVVPRVFDAGVNRPYVVAILADAHAGAPESGYNAQFVHISGQSDFFLNRRIVCHPRMQCSRAASASFQIKTSQGIVEGVDTCFNLKAATDADVDRYYGGVGPGNSNSGTPVSASAAAAAAAAGPSPGITSAIPNSRMNNSNGSDRGGGGSSNTADMPSLPTAPANNTSHTAAGKNEPISAAAPTIGRRRKLDEL